MPRVTNHAVQTAPQTNGAAADVHSKPLVSQVDEIERILSNIFRQLPENIQHVPSVQAWIDAYPQQSNVPWSNLPESVDAGSTNMGLSTAKSDKKRAKKLQKLDMDKVNARVLRKRQQVESFLAVLQPLLSTAGHTPAPHINVANKSTTSPPSPSAVAAAAAISAGTTRLQHCEEPQQPQQQQQQEQKAACNSRPLHIVDFGCGSGNLLLPLAALYPSCCFTGVDMKPAALQLLQQRAAAAGLSNVQVFQGMIEHYQQPFDVALALHACGNATDHVLQMAVDQQAAFIVSPCCVGKLKFSMTGGSSFHSSSSITYTPRQPGDKPPPGSSHIIINSSNNGCDNAAQIFPQQQQLEQRSSGAMALPAAADGSNCTFVSRLRHPRSCWLESLLPDPQRHFRIMARVADMSHAPADQVVLGEALAHRAAVAEHCKRFVELDRCAAAAEAGYAVGLFKVFAAETMAKNDLLVGIPASSDSKQQQDEGFKQATADVAVDPKAMTAAAAAAATTASGHASVSQEPGRELHGCSRQFARHGLLLKLQEFLCAQ